MMFGIKIYPSAAGYSVVSTVALPGRGHYLAIAVAGELQVWAGSTWRRV